MRFILLILTVIVILSPQYILAAEEKTTLQDVEARKKELTAECEKDIEGCRKALMKSNLSAEYLKTVHKDRFKIWQEGADLGLPLAQYLLARCYEEGLTVEKNPAKGLELHRKAAENDSSDS